MHITLAYRRLRQEIKNSRISWATQFKVILNYVIKLSQKQYNLCSEEQVVKIVITIKTVSPKTETKVL